MAFGPTVGLDIGSQQIKVVEVRPGKGRISVSALGIAPTPPGVMQNNIITDPSAMAQAVRQLLRESGVTAKKVVGSVAGQSAVVVRVIEVPKMTEAELRETMRWEVERHVPFPPSETEMAYAPLTPLDPANDNSPNMEVLLAVAQRDIVSNFLDTLFKAGLKPSAIDIEPLAAGRALLDMVNGQPVIQTTPFSGDANGYQPVETVAIVNIGASNTDIGIFQNGQLSFPRSLPLAGDSLTRAIAESPTLGYAPEQAERIKRDQASIQMDRIGIYTGTDYSNDPGYSDAGYQGPSFDEFDGPQFDEPERTQPIPESTLNLARPNESESFSNLDFNDPIPTPASSGDTTVRDQVFDAIAPVLSEIANELRRSFDYFRSRAQGRSVDRVLLIGGTASLTNLAHFLQNELQVPVTVADPLAGLEVTARKYDPAHLHTIAPTFAIALGLALRDAVFDANPVGKTVKPKAAARVQTTGQPLNVTNPPTS